MKPVLISVFISILLLVILEFYAVYLLDGLQWVFNQVGKMANISINTLDLLIIAFIPFWSFLIFNQKQKRVGKKIIENFLLMFIALAFVGLGILLIIQLDLKPSPLLPSYLVSQPFYCYWATMVGSGIILTAAINRLDRVRSR